MAPNRERIEVAVKPECCLVIALSLLLIHWKWVVAWVAAAGVHELFHYTAIRICKCDVWGIDIGVKGTSMKTYFEQPWMELVSAAAGPLGSIGLGLLSGVFPRVAVCGYIQFLFNLLPIYPNDGGRILKVLFEHWISPSMVVKVLSVLNCCLCCMVLIGALYIAVRYAIGLLPVLSALIICMRIKKPCKRRLMRVQ